MGHERIGFLPKTKQWKTIVDQLADYGTGSDTVAQIADTTLMCIRTLYEELPYEESLIKSVRFLINHHETTKQKIVHFNIQEMTY